jgi:quinohemoprotein ethanol dehydrogenase
MLDFVKFTRSSAFGAAVFVGMMCVLVQPVYADSAMADADHNWQAFGRTHSEQRYSPLAQIQRRNVAKLGIDWALDLPDAVAFTSTPLAVNGVLYFSGDRAIVRAVDARTGTLLWTHDPQVWRHAPRGMAAGWNVNRGIAYSDGRVYVGTADGRLLALDAKTGDVAWTARHFLAESRKAITGPPRVAGGKVFIGHGGAEFGTRGYVDAFDAQSGKHLWRFHTVPGDPSDGFENAAMEMAAKTWHGQWWKYGGGGTVWHAITYDPELNRVYLGVGNGDPWDYVKRSEGKGDNLFLCSIVALDADTGQYVWHYQMNPGEEWDYKATADIVLADLKIQGKTRKVLMQAPTNGFFYVIDRESGKLLSAEKYDKVTWAERIDMTTGRPVEAPGVRPRGTDKVTIYPGPWGAHTWHSMSYSPRTNLVYVPTMRISGTFGQVPPYPFREKFFTIGKLIEHPTDPNDSSGSLLAWDPVAQRERWRVDYTAVWNGGTLATAGDLVFHGTADGDFRAFDARSGKQLWAMNMQRGISSAPISYSVDGKQRIALLVGWGGLMAVNNAAFQKHGWKYKGPGIRLVSFSLDGTAALPAVPETRFALTPADPGPTPIDAALAAQGFGLYHLSSCAVCHGAEAKSNGASAPDLRESTLAMSYEGFKAVVADGALLANGMPMFNDFSEQELRAVHEYVRQQTQLAVPRAAGR